jgi:hypothetical protein
MPYTYELITDDFGNEVVKRNDGDGVTTWIPKDSANADYQRYLNPEAEQSTPLGTDNE